MRMIRIWASAGPPSPSKRAKARFHTINLAQNTFVPRLLMLVLSHEKM
jgi:hypothetical protein